MTGITDSPSRVRRGGAALIAATVVFAVVFSYLAAAFDYPDVLSRPAAEVLPALLALGGTGRLVWLIYGLVPVLLVPAALGVQEAARTAAPRLGRLAMLFALVSAATMMMGLLRWPTLQWSLAGQWMSASPGAQDVIASQFAAANLYLGNVIGEFAGELFLNAFFLVSALALAAARPGLRWLTYAGMAASAFGWIAMLRNLTPAVAAIAEINNSVLPLFMLTLGIALVAQGRRSR